MAILSTSALAAACGDDGASSGAADTTSSRRDTSGADASRRDTSSANDAERDEGAAETTAAAEDTTGGSCSGDARRCSGRTIEVCVDGAFLALEVCAADRVCDAGFCVEPPACPDGEVVCQGDDLVRCGANGWTVIASCTFGCEDGACGIDEPPACDVGALACDGADLVRCVDGAWALLATCAHGCVAGACASPPPACDDGAVACDGDDVVHCDDGVWEILATCADGCSGGACDAPVGTDTCYDILVCVDDRNCTVEDEECLDVCLETASSIGEQRFDALMACTLSSDVDSWNETCSEESAWCVYESSGADSCQDVLFCAKNCSSLACETACIEDGTRTAQADFLWLFYCVGDYGCEVGESCFFPLVLDECHDAFVNCD